MNLSEMRNEFRRIVNQLDASNSNFSDSQVNIWLNEAYRFIITKLDQIPQKTRDYTSADTISLNVRTLVVNSARLQAQPENEFRNLQVIDHDTLVRIDPDYEAADTDVPRFFVRVGTFSARLHPRPNAANTGQTVRTFGLEFPTDLSADADVPDLPLNMHDLFAHYAAYRAFQQLEDNDRSASELIQVNGILKAQHAITTKFSNQENRWKFSSEVNSGFDGTNRLPGPF